MNKNLMILPTELDVTDININKEIELRIIQYNKSKIKREAEIYKNQRKIETNDEAYKLTKEEKEKISFEIINSDDTKNLKLKLYDNIKKEKEDYLNLRTDLYNLNFVNETNLNEYINIEKINLYSFDKLPKYNEILLESIKYKDNYYHQLNNKVLSISNYFENNDENIDNNQLEHLKYQTLDKFLFIKEMYEITKDVDDFDLFDKYEYNNNIDFCEDLSENIRQIIKNGNNYDNFLNQFNISQNNNHSFVKNNKISNKILSLLLSNKYISDNKVTCFETMFTITSSNKHVYMTRTLGELLIEITNDDNFEINKDKRQQIYMTYDGTRPGTEQYHKWNGLQIYDLDLKKWIEKGGNIDELKNSIHNMMVDFNWYLWICKSASGKGLHVYTKIAPPLHYFTNLIENEYMSKYIHRLNYLTKRQILNDILFRIHKIENNNIYFDTPDYGYPYDTEENLTGKSLDNEYLDNSVGRITSGIRLAFDTYPLVNENFIDLPLGAEMSKAYNGFEEYNIKFIFDTISSNKFYNSFVKSINEDLAISDYNQWLQGKEQKSHIIDYEELKSKYKSVLNLSTDLDEVKPMNKTGINYFIRYNVCNTLASLFGKDGLPLAHALLNSRECKNIGEINSFYSCAITNRKEVTKVGLEILRKNGIIKQIAEELVIEVTNSYKDNLKSRINQVLANQTTKIDYHLSEGEYLTSIINELEEQIVGEKINMIYSPPGTGKCLGYGTEILMFDGSVKQVQDIIVGDKLMGWDSKPRNVLSTCTGKEELIKIIPNKGESWICNKSHILSVIESGKWTNEYLPNVNDIQDVNVLDTNKFKKNHRLKLFKTPLDFDFQKVLLPPYWLGYWLGDGISLTTGITCCDEDSKIILPYLEEYAKILKYKVTRQQDFREGKKVSVYNIVKPEKNSNPNKLKEALKSYNLISNKHIPKEYLLNSRKIRLEILAGLIDSDGGGDDCTIDYVTKLPELAENIKFLCRSLGFMVNHKTKTINGKIYQRLLISGDFKDVPIKLKRKKFIRNINKNPLVYGFKTESIGEGNYYGFEIDGDKRFMLGDFTVTHNTTLVKELSKNGKRIMLALPYVSVIKNKIENDPSVRQIFDVFYGSDDIKSIEGDKNVVTTFDKLSRTNYEKISRMFDYVMIDEEHLLFTSGYRIDTTSLLIKKIKELFYLSNNDPNAAKVVLLTGTPTGSEHYFNKFKNIIKISKKSHKKTMEFLICDDNLDAITRLASKARDFISQGYCLMIPTNKGELYSEKLIGMIEYLLQKPVKYGYYKRSNIEQEICRMINEQETVGDYDIVFCSNYLSVGVDINDKDRKFASIYLGNFSGYEIEQFNARIRQQEIHSIYCITTQKSDGNINDKLLEEPNLILRITDEEAMNFADDKSIAAAKTEFIASYDPVLKRITTPGFSLLNGKIQFNMEEYELITFENKYSECMEHPIKVARELAKFGYDINISSEYDGLTKSEQELLKKMGLESMQNEKVKKHELLVGTFIDLIRKNNYINENGLEHYNLIEWIQKNSSKVIEDRDLNKDGEPIFILPTYDVFATPIEVFVRSKEALEKMIKSAKYLNKKYSDIKAINIIMQYVDSNGILKQKYFQRSINLLKLIDSSEANELTEPISRALDKMYVFVDKFEADKNYRIGYDTWQTQLDTWVNEYVDDLGIKISTKYGWDKIKDGLTEMINDLATRQTSKNGIKFNYNKLPEQDSTLILNRQSIDNLVTNMFKITENVITNKKQLKSKHIVLMKQEF